MKPAVAVNGIQTQVGSRDALDLGQLLAERERLLQQIAQLDLRAQKAEEARRALLHIMSDLHAVNRRHGDQRKAMLHILEDHEQHRRRVAGHSVRLDNSRRALLHILNDSHQSNLKLENGRKAMIHIMSDLHETTLEVQRREQELRDKQEQLIQAGKLATMGELTTGIAHELNNPLNNIGLFIGNAIDRIRLGTSIKENLLQELDSAMQQVRKATEIISHLRIFGRAAPVSHDPISVNEVVKSALFLMQPQLRLRQIEIELELCPGDPVVIGNAIQLEQVFINLLSNARDALADSEPRVIQISSALRSEQVEIVFADTGPGIPEGLEQRIFDPFFTTKEVGAGTGLGLSITYGIIKDHNGTVSVVHRPEGGAVFVIYLPHSSERVLEKPAS